MWVLGIKYVSFEFKIYSSTKELIMSVLESTISQRTLNIYYSFIEQFDPQVLAIVTGKQKIEQ